MMNGETAINQRICGKLVGRYIGSNVSLWAEESIKAGILDIEEVENLYMYNLEGALGWDTVKKLGLKSYVTREELDKAVEDIGDRIANLDQVSADNQVENEYIGDSAATESTELTKVLEALERLDVEEQEVYEWWIIEDNWFLQRLQAKGEVVWQTEMAVNLWGRCCTGQAIKLDGVIQDIARDMWILHGMKNEWSAD